MTTTKECRKCKTCRYASYIKVTDPSGMHTDNIQQVDKGIMWCDRKKITVQESFNCWSYLPNKKKS